jgi:hypothetical protein
MREKLPYAGAALSAALYAWWVESRPQKYHPDATWPNVLGGVALTGVWVGVRYAVEPPDSQPAPVSTANPLLRAALWVLRPAPRSLRWAWMVTFWMFWATGVPVVTWEELAKDGRYHALVAYLRGSHRDQAATAGEPGGRAG